MTREMLTINTVRGVGRMLDFSFRASMVLKVTIWGGCGGGETSFSAIFSRACNSFSECLEETVLPGCILNLGEVFNELGLITSGLMSLIPLPTVQRLATEESLWISRIAREDLSPTIREESFFLPNALEDSN